jgi:anti-anti-sigma regulatory factor
MTPPDDRPSPALRIDVSQGVTGAWIQIHGEVHVMNHVHLHDMLFALDVLRADPMCLDLRRLTFCDTAGCDHLVDFVRRTRRTGRDVSILGARSSVITTIRLIAPHETLTFL